MHLIGRFPSPTLTRPSSAHRSARLVVVLTLLMLLLTALVPAPAVAAGARYVDVQRWTSTTNFTSGTHSGTKASSGAVTFSKSKATAKYKDPYGGSTKTYDVATWTSAPVKTTFGLNELIMSWSAVTPKGTFVEFQAQGVTDKGKTTTWYSMGRWAHWDSSSRIRRTSVKGQRDAYASVLTDTLRTASGTTLKSYKVRVKLHRVKGSKAKPYVRTLTAMASRLPREASVTTSKPGVATGVQLNVPAYSQMVHRGHSPRYGNGGEAWCSPTSTAMVLDYLKLGPRKSSMSWVPSGHPNPSVDHAAKMTYDYAYKGTGNWSFNAAYANHEGAEAFVTRFRSLRDAEPLIKAGIPLVVSTSFKSSALSGAGYSTYGHLMVIVGFDAKGNVIVNDPASHLKASNSQVRTTYRRDQFENAWIPTSGGLAYVIAPRGKALPKPAHSRNW